MDGGLRLSVSGPTIWFVDASASPGGDGRLSSPFDCLVGTGCFQPTAADGPGDFIFIADGSYLPGLVLLNTQTVIGEGSSSTLEILTGATPPAGSDPLPGLGGTPPVITGTGDGITLALDNTVRGLDIGNTASTGLVGSEVGTLFVREVGISGTGGGVDLTSTTGASIDVILDSLSASSSSDEGIFLSGVSGTFNITGATGTISTTGVPAVDITGAADPNEVALGTMAFQSISTNGSGGAVIGINLTNTTGTFSVNGTGTTDSSGGTIENMLADGVTLNNTAGLITFKNMDFEDIGSTAGGFDTRSQQDAIHGQDVMGGLTLDNVFIDDISDMAINGALFSDGISATTWNGLSLLNGTLIEDANRFHVAGVGDSSDEGAVRIVGIRGTVTVDDTTIRRSGEHLDFTVTTGSTPLNMTVTDSTFEFAYKEFTSGGTSSVAKMCIDVTVQGTADANVTIGDESNAADGNSFLNCRLASVRVGNDTGATGDIDAIVANNSFVVNDHSSGIGGDFDFPQGGVKYSTRGEDAATFDGIIADNTFDQVTNADGGVGQVTLDLEDGTHQVRVEGNTFDTPGNAAWFVRGDSSVSSKVHFLDNNYIRGFFTCPDTSCGGGYFGPGLLNTAQIQNGADMDLVIDGDDFALHDVGFDPGNTVKAEIVNVGGGGTMCVHFTNTTSPHGYRLRENAGTLELQGSGATTSGSCAADGGSHLVNDAAPATCRTVLSQNSSTGGAGVAGADPPDVDVLINTVDILDPTTSACLLPSGGIF